MKSKESSRPSFELEILSRVGRIAVADLEVQPMLQRICDALREALDWDLVAIVSVDAARSVVVCEALSTALETTVRVGDETPLESGVVGEVARNGGPVVVDRPADCDEWVRVFSGAHSQICVPIRHRDETLALLNAESRQPGAFAGQLDFTELVAAQIAGAIAAGRNLERCQRHSALIENALQLNRLALSATDLETMSESIVRFLQERFNLSWVSLSIAPRGDLLKGPKLVAVSGHGNRRTRARAASRAALSGVVARAAITGQSQLVPDVRDDPDYVEHCELTRSELALPLYFRGQLLGVLNLESPDRAAFGPEQRALFHVAASEFAAVVHMARLNHELDSVNKALSAANDALAEAMEELRLQAELDGLTGVANRRLFDVALRREWDRARRFGRGLGLVMVDLDHFKEINDTAGHLAGDDALRAVSRVLEGHLKRAGDFLARYGGEEFVVLLVDVEEWQTYAQADQLRRVVEDAALPHPTRVRLTASVGAAWMLATAESRPDELLASADARLYAAKKGGRNRAVCVT